MSDTLRIYYTGLPCDFYSCCSQQLLYHRSYMCTCLVTSSERRGQDSVCAHTQLSCVYLVSTLDVTHMIKCIRLSPSLVGRAWERGYDVVTLTNIISTNICLGQIKLFRKYPPPPHPPTLPSPSPSTPPHTLTILNRRISKCLHCLHVVAISSEISKETPRGDDTGMSGGRVERRGGKYGEQYGKE